MAILLGLVLVSCASNVAAPSASLPVDSATPIASPQRPEPTLTLAPTVAVSPSPSPVSGLAVPGFVTIAADALIVREEPGLTGEPVIDASTCIDNPNPCERPFTVGTDRGYLWAYAFDGPISADGYEWYLIATEMNHPDHGSIWPEAVGWVAAGDGEDDWLVPDVRTCPGEPIELADVTNLALTKLEMLHCLSARELTLRGWLPAVVDGERDPTVVVDECRMRSPWLMCGSMFDMVRPVEAGWAGDADYLDFVVDPASDIVMPNRSQWVTIAGQFDHPDAAACGDAAAVLICRSSFVLTSIEPG